MTYQLKKRAESGIAFGTASERKMFPHFVPPNRNGNQLIAIRGVPQIGPGKYDVEEV